MADNSERYSLIFQLKDQISAKLASIRKGLRDTGNQARTMFNGAFARMDSFKKKIDGWAEKLSLMPGLFGKAGAGLGALLKLAGPLALLAGGFAALAAGVAAFVVQLNNAIPKEKELLSSSSVLSALTGAKFNDAKRLIQEMQKSIASAALDAGVDSKRAMTIFQASIDEIAMASKGNQALFRTLARDQALNLAFLTSTVDVTPMQVKEFTNKFLRASLSELKATEIGSAPGFADFAEAYAKARGKIFDELNAEERVALLTAFRNQRTSPEFKNRLKKSLGFQLDVMGLAFSQAFDFTRTLKSGTSIIERAGRIFNIIFDPDVGIVGRFAKAFGVSRLGRGADIQDPIDAVLSVVEKLAISIQRSLPNLGEAIKFFDGIERYLRTIRNNLFLTWLKIKPVVEALDSIVRYAAQINIMLHPSKQAQSMTSLIGMIQNVNNWIARLSSVNPILNQLINPAAGLGLPNPLAESRAKGLASSGARLPLSSAIAAEMAAKPAGSNLVIANSSEVILNREQFAALRAGGGGMTNHFNISGVGGQQVADLIVSALDQAYHRYRLGGA